MLGKPITVKGWIFAVTDRFAITIMFPSLLNLHELTAGLPYLIRITIGLKLETVENVTNTMNTMVLQRLYEHYATLNTWDSSRAFFQSRGKDLCTIDELCRNENANIFGTLQGQHYGLPLKKIDTINGYLSVKSERVLPTTTNHGVLQLMQHLLEIPG